MGMGMGMVKSGALAQKGTIAFESLKEKEEGTLLLQEL